MLLNSSDSYAKELPVRFPTWTDEVVSDFCFWEGGILEVLNQSVKTTNKHRYVQQTYKQQQIVNTGKMEILFIYGLSV